MFVLGNDKKGEESNLSSQKKMKFVNFFGIIL